MKIPKPKKKICSRGHEFVRSKELPVCPKCYPGYYKKQARNAKWDISFRGAVQKFHSAGGWMYVAVPQKYTKELKNQRRAWGMYPITAHVGNTIWKTKLMMKKGGDFFVALKTVVRSKEKIALGDKVAVSIRME